MFSPELSAENLVDTVVHTQAHKRESFTAETFQNSSGKSISQCYFTRGLFDDAVTNVRLWCVGEDFQVAVV
jgi:hypothetical protein